MRDRIIRLIQKSDYLFFIIKYWRLRILMVIGRRIPDETYIRKQYRLRLKKDLNLENPQLYNEKMQYYKLHYHDPAMLQMADKYEVRKYVAQVIGEKYLTELYGVYDSVDQIPFDSLPDRFAIKLTNGSGFNIICTRKTPKEIRKIRSRFRKWMKLDFYMLGREWVYKDIPNRILCEEYLEAPDAMGLNDYKVFCFQGEPRLIQVDFERFVDHKRNLYTPDWKFIDEKVAYENDPDADVRRPEHLEEMLECARKLSAPFPHVRVDFYSIGPRLVFGEMTFYHGAGYLKFENEAFERELGACWEM